MRVFLLMLMSISASVFSQPIPKASPNPANTPKLVVGIVVDQMRWDYLYRYSEKYGSTGFKRLMNRGYNCENAHINYLPTYTAPGHTCIYTGSVPAIHGIVGNAWYERASHSIVYCTSDTNYHTVGSTSDAGRMAPTRLLTTTITDELRLASNFKSKVIGIAIKDRGAILPTGHTANAAYWLDKNGDWISSSYYEYNHDTLPSWVQRFNAQKLPAKYLADNWKTIQTLNTYTESTEDDKSYESPYKGEEKPVFTHAVAGLMAKNADIIKNTPWGNTLTFDLAKAAIKGEKLGNNSATDFLTVSCSSTDYIGHQFGPNSVEIEDCYLRFDRDLGSFLSYLDSTVGEDRYLLFLTADHGASHAAGFNQEHHIHTGVFVGEGLVSRTNELLKTQYGVDHLVDTFDNMQLYLNLPVIAKEKLNIDAIKASLTYQLLAIKGIAQVVDLSHIGASTIIASQRELLANGYYQQRSGDLQLIYEPGYLEGYTKGTTHGTGYAYDTHIPLIWYGKGITEPHDYKVIPKYDYAPINMTDIAATLAALLQIQEPSGSVGKPIDGVVNYRWREKKK